jgi:putative oxidoreductase
MNVTYLELAAGAALVVGIFTPLAYGGAASIVFVALMTNHLKNGFWSFSAGEGWEYTGTLTAICIVIATFSPGEWSLDHAIGWDFPFQPATALTISALIGIVGTGIFLAIFWRPPTKTDG